MEHKRKLIKQKDWEILTALTHQKIRLMSRAAFLRLKEPNGEISLLRVPSLKHVFKSNNDAKLIKVLCHCPYSD